MRGRGSFVPCLLIKAFVVQGRARWFWIFGGSFRGRLFPPKQARRSTNFPLNYVLTVHFTNGCNGTNTRRRRHAQVTGIFFESKVDYTTWFGPNVEFIHGIQVRQGGLRRHRTVGSRFRRVFRVICSRLLNTQDEYSEDLFLRNRNKCDTHIYVCTTQNNQCHIDA